MCRTLFYVLRNRRNFERIYSNLLYPSIITPVNLYSKPGNYKFWKLPKVKMTMTLGPILNLFIHRANLIHLNPKRIESKHISHIQVFFSSSDVNSNQRIIPFHYNMIIYLMSGCNGFCDDGGASLPPLAVYQVPGALGHVPYHGCIRAVLQRSVLQIVGWDPLDGSQSNFRMVPIHFIVYAILVYDFIWGNVTDF